MVVLGVVDLCLRSQPVAVSPEKLFYEVTSRVRTRSRPVPPGPVPSQVGAREWRWRTQGGVRHLDNPCPLCHCSLQALKTPEATGYSRMQRGAALDSGSSLTLGSSLSRSLSRSPSPRARGSLHGCLEPSSMVWTPQSPLLAQPPPQ